MLLDQVEFCGRGGRTVTTRPAATQHPRPAPEFKASRRVALCNEEGLSCLLGDLNSRQTKGGMPLHLLCQEINSPAPGLTSYGGTILILTSSVYCPFKLNLRLATLLHGQDQGSTGSVIISCHAGEAVDST